jgi:hypothetical protein
MLAPAFEAKGGRLSHLVEMPLLMIEVIRELLAERYRTAPTGAAIRRMSKQNAGPSYTLGAAASANVIPSPPKQNPTALYQSRSTAADPVHPKPTMKTTDWSGWRPGDVLSRQRCFSGSSRFLDLNKAPSYTGKAALLDKLIAAQTLAHNLAFSLAHDCEPK